MYDEGHGKPFLRDAFIYVTLRRPRPRATCVIAISVPPEAIPATTGRQEKEREPVPVSVQQNSVDSLSALALLIRRVADTGRCEASARMFDGNRASEITAHTAGDEVLAPTTLSSFSGKTLRCDFLGQMLAGFRYRP